MSGKKEQAKRERNEDADFDELLDSALENFSKKDEKEESKSKSSEKDGKQFSSSEWADVFILQAACQLENICELLETVPKRKEAVTQEQLQQSLQKVAEAAAPVVANSQRLPLTQQTNDFASTISQTLQNLSLEAENLQNPFSGANAFQSFMHEIFQIVLLEKVLFPTLKVVLDKYPAWLDENKSKRDAYSHEKYTKQMNLIKEIYDELEMKQETDDKTFKQERFDKVLHLMHQMRDLGALPTELVRETENLPFNIQGNVDFEGFNMNDPNQCSLM